jgi:hypothetical protein
MRTTTISDLEQTAISPAAPAARSPFAAGAGVNDGAA